MTIYVLKKEFLPFLAPEDFYVLLAHASGKSREYLLAHPEHELDEETGTRVRDFFTRRLAREPVAYITGGKEFFGLPFRVTPDTLIPRPETESLVERVIGDLRLQIADCKSEATKKILIADIGTGSGAIIIALAHTFKKDAGCMMQDTRYEFHAVDISNDALIVARENAGQNGVADIISFHEGSLINPITEYFSNAEKIILIATLPYLSETLYSSADDDVKRYEPRQALLSGKDGLDHYRALFESIKKHILTLPTYHFSVLCEISPEQDAIITQLFDNTFPEGHSEILPDLSGRSRVFSFRLYKA